MKVAVIGTGSWGKVLAANATALGHDVDVHSSRTVALIPLPDAVLLAVPPHVQEAIAPPFLHRRIPTFMEKPLALSTDGARRILGAVGPTIAAVDHVRLMAPTWRTFRDELHRESVSSATAAIGGPGPIRDWPTAYPHLWDYGPHALAYLLDLFGDDSEVKVDAVVAVNGHVTARMRFDGVPVGFDISNRSSTKVAIVRAGKAVYVFNSESERPLTSALKVFFRAVETKVPVPVELSVARAAKIVEILEDISSAVRSDVEPSMPPEAA